MQVERQPVTQVFLCDVLRAPQQQFDAPRIAVHCAAGRRVVLGGFVLGGFVCREVVCREVVCR